MGAVGRDCCEERGNEICLYGALASMGGVFLGLGGIFTTVRVSLQHFSSECCTVNCNQTTAVCTRLSNDLPAWLIDSKNISQMNASAINDAISDKETVEGVLYTAGAVFVLPLACFAVYGVYRCVAFYKKRSEYQVIEASKKDLEENINPI